MSRIQEKYSLKALNTFGIEAHCDFYTEVHTKEEFQDLVQQALFHNSKKLILGGGSNLLFVSDFKGLVIRNCLKGLEVIRENDQEVVIRAGAGENWHNFVLWCIGHNYAGLENLSLIPGCVGASPMQNIGAYGVEIKDVFEELEALSLKDGSSKIFKKEDCRFAYRESVFKREHKDEYFIATVSFRLKKKAVLNISYGAISTELQNMKISEPGIREVSEAVIRIRQSKLPDPAVLGNAGSFFKNPEVSSETYHRIKQNYEHLVAYPLDNGHYKLAAGWLIEQCGLKGLEQNGAAVHDKQALVLVNKKNCTGADVYALSEFVLTEVQKKFDVKLEREVNIVA